MKRYTFKIIHCYKNKKEDVPSGLGYFSVPVETPDGGFVSYYDHIRELDDLRMENSQSIINSAIEGEKWNAYVEHLELKVKKLEDTVASLKTTIELQKRFTDDLMRNI